uniref:DNA (cytosine-5-)-methyltransferase n=1 Tax=Gasterosteus aculeatus aculeatus TaxID=481459 RepID=A0AAQ4S0E1_GASAC
MDMEVAVNVFLPKPTQLIPDDGLLAWLNDTLQTSFTNAEQLCGGGAFCQLMNWLFPKSIDLSSVQFLCNNMVDAIPNYRLLNAAFKKVGVLRVSIVTKELIKKDTAWFLAFLYWFKAFFERNLHQDRKYNPLEARGGQSMVPAYSGKSVSISHSCYTGIVISDEDDDVMDLTAEEETETQKTTVEEDSKDKRVTQAVAAMQKGSGRSDDTLLRFVKRYRHTSGDSQVSGPILSPNHPTDIVMACSRVPYSLYLYVGVELGGGQNTSVVLVGYFDQSSGVSVLKKCGLLLSKVVTFYCNAPHPGVSRVFVSMLQAYNPKLMSLCGLPDVAERACQAGLLASFSCVVDLVRDIHDLLHTYPPVSDDLKGLFLEPYNPSRPVQVLFTTHSVQRIASSWRPLVDYLKSLKQADERIRTQLMDHKVKLRFIFLSHMLEPLQALQKLQECGTSVVAEVQLTAMLVRFYATNLLRPSVAEHFFTMRDVRVLQDGTKLLPITEVQVGARAREFLWATAVVDLGEQERRDFLKDAATFYKAALECLVESLPRHLGEVVLTNIYTVLKHSGSIRVRTFIFLIYVFVAKASFHLLSQASSRVEDSDYTDNSSGETVSQVCAVGSEHQRRQQKHFNNENQRKQHFQTLWTILNNVFFFFYFSSDVVDTTEVFETSPSASPMKTASKRVLIKIELEYERLLNQELQTSYHLFLFAGRAPALKYDIYSLASLLCVIQHVIGELVWGQVDGFSPWPAIIRCSGGEQLPDTGMVEWYGQNMSSQVSLKALKPFAAFAQHFCSNSFAILITYREALFTSLQEAALRCKKDFSEFVGDRDELLKHMLDWALGGFQPTGPDGLKPTDKSSPFDGFDDDMSPDFLPYKKKTINKPYNKVNQTTSAYTQPDQELRGFCLCCGTKDVDIFHPLFKGSLCSMCKDNLKETLYCFDDDGYQSYCTICCYGLEVLLCGNDSCGRCYCTDCLNILVGPGTFDSLKAVDPWICYLCQPHKPHGALIPREDWSIRVQELFANTSAMEFEPHRVYPSIPANLRRPVRVLSLFDGIATGYFVLKELGFKVEAYVASEICEDSLAVATINHDGKIHHVGDARFITHEHINEWGPFDLLIGGSPCNDLSIVNPLRKGVYEGTGRLFFEYYRILQLLKPKEEDPRPFFWLFENVVFMNTHDKVNICRFLECNPVLVNAVNVSPAHRARCFWGNIPGMSRPITASQNDKLNLQDCLEIGRKARVSKVRTITTNPNSLKQGKGVNSLLPVLHNGKEDNLWITELERIFGFPKHYTDVRNMNRQQRQKVLGKAWSVPVIRHLFAPLKDYFACEELPPLTTSNSSPSPSSPASPELEQLR